MKLKKLDRRMNGYGDFKYGVDLWTVDSKEFMEVRQWCWETFGPSCELDIWEYLDRPGDSRNPSWAWDRGTYNKNFRCIVYLATDVEASHFTLKWL